MSIIKEEYPEIWTYIVTAGTSADQLTCGVPLKINDDYIFFGPCMKNYRKNLYERYLKNQEAGSKNIKEDIYFLGMSGSKVKNAKQDRIRKILWFGKLISAFTFESMLNFIDSLENKELKTDFEKIRDLEDSPLHIQPIYENGQFLGYELRSTYHYGKWFADIATKKAKLKLNDEKKVLLLNPEERSEVFHKDCCLILERLFYAEGQGLIIDDDVLKIFKRHPDLAEKADTITNPYFIYGKRKSSEAEGRQGKGLKFTGDLGKELLNLMIKKIQNVKKIVSPSILDHRSNICK